MSVEIKVYSPKPLLTAVELAAAVRKWGFEMRLLDGNDQISESPINGPLKGDFVALMWDARDTQTTAVMDAAFSARDKAPVDELAQKEKVAWCGLSGGRFDYAEFWSEYPDEVDEYEEGVPPEDLAKMKAAVSRYWLRCGTRPATCGQAAEGLARVLVKVTGGVTE